MNFLMSSINYCIMSIKECVFCNPKKTEESESLIYERLAYERFIENKRKIREYHENNKYLDLNETLLINSRSPSPIITDSPLERCISPGLD